VNRATVVVPVMVEMAQGTGEVSVLTWPVAGKVPRRCFRGCAMMSDHVLNAVEATESISRMLILAKPHRPIQPISRAILQLMLQPMPRLLGSDVFSASITTARAMVAAGSISGGDLSVGFTHVMR
jgi:hypothetical protein